LLYTYNICEESKIIKVAMGKEQSMNRFKCGGEFNNGSYPPSNTIIMTKDKEGIALKGATLQNYNAELVHRKFQDHFCLIPIILK
jgi:hypothetical protein